MCDWTSAETEYVTGDDGYRGIGKKYGVSSTAVCKYGKAHDWVQKREEYRNTTATKVVQKSAEKISEIQSDIIAMQASSALRIAERINEYLNLDMTIKPFDLLRLTNAWQILQDGMRKDETVTESDVGGLCFLPEQTDEEGR